MQRTYKQKSTTDHIYEQNTQPSYIFDVFKINHFRVVKVLIKKSVFMSVSFV